MDRFDVAVIGGGPAGYVAAIRAAQLGLSAACIDDRAGLGGTCLNVGCIPSKALLSSTEKLWEARHRLGEHGISVNSVDVDLKKLMAHKERAVEQLTGGVSQLFKKNKVTHLPGRGRLQGKGRVEVVGSNKSDVIEAAHIIIATGSAPTELPPVPVDGRRIVDSTGALAFEEIPEHLVVVGGGYIGLELGVVWSRLGATVTCFELTERILPGMDAELAEKLQPLLEEQGMSFRLKTGIAKAEPQDACVRLSVKNDSSGSEAKNGNGNEEGIECSHVLVAIGRRPLCDGLGLEEAGVETTEDGFVRVDREFRTSAEGIFAIGDVACGPMLAHKAHSEAVSCAEIIAGRPSRVNYGVIPAIVYTWPEVASVGETEAALKERGANYQVGRFNFKANGRARSTGDDVGFAKILVDPESNLLLGAHILGPDAGTLIHEAAITMELGGSAEELGKLCHAHPTFNEVVREAALDTLGLAIHG